MNLKALKRKMRTGLNDQYAEGMALFGNDFLGISDEGRFLLGAIVNNAKALAKSLGEGVGDIGG